MNVYEILMKETGKPILLSCFNPITPTEQEITSDLKENNDEARKKKHVSLDITLAFVVQY